MLLSYEAWSRLRREQALDPASAQRVLERGGAGADRRLTPGAPAPPYVPQKR